METNNLKTGRREFLKKSTSVAAGITAFSAGLISPGAIAAPLEKQAAVSGKRKIAMVGTGSRAGVMASLVGIAARKSIETGETINIKDLVTFPLTWGWK